MCTVVCAYKVHSDYPVICVGNRDEFLNRPTKPCHWWADHPEILAGRDLRAKGTWMGINKSGRFGVLTNYREMPFKEGVQSRGLLIPEFLKDGRSEPSFVKSLEKKSDQFSGLNFLGGSYENLFYYSNRGIGLSYLNPGIYGLSNALLNNPWPKLLKAKSLVEDWISSDSLEPIAIIEAFNNKEIFLDDQLPNTGVGLEIERILSALFIESENYGTMSTWILMMHKSGKVAYTERFYLNGKILDSNYNYKVTSG